MLDIDAQQPYFYNPGSDMTSDSEDEKLLDDEDTRILQKMKRYSFRDHSRWSIEGKYHVTLTDRFIDSYSGQVDHACSLDEYYFEIINKEDLNARNGDQVLSRFIARSWAEKNDRRPSWELNLPQDSEALSSSQLFRTKRPIIKESGTGKSTAPRQMVLTVPKLWVWKADSKCFLINHICLALESALLRYRHINIKYGRYCCYDLSSAMG